MAIAYSNGTFIDLDEKVIPIDERGHQFGDGVYEVIRVYDGKPFMLKEHIERLIQSGKAIKLKIDENVETYEELIQEGISRSGLRNCDVYLQITRGIAPRNHLFPNAPVSITMTVKPAKEMPKENRENGVRAIFHPDERWAKCFIKSLNLLPNILAKQEAFEKGCFEAIMHKEGYVTEGTSSNVFIVKDGAIYTTPLTENILPGITRIAVKQLVNRLNIPFVEKNVTTTELLKADEVFITSTTAEVLPVVEVEGNTIGSGKVGAVTSTLYAAFQQVAKGETIHERH
ncbi:D-amino-acid transaminase [Bacillus kexueae]|uniref:D-amino-acid transaminase n=1 Tax=Aeribacillus kexueae TaxID=2078952 RepID=UPI001FAF4F9C|nr:D-amino-acid transaminase [Bacillus kexueae]